MYFRFILLNFLPKRRVDEKLFKGWQAMKTREIVLPFITSVLIFSTTVFISCASRQRVEGDQVAEETTVQGEGDPLPPADSKVADADALGLGEVPPDNGQTEKPATESASANNPEVSPSTNTAQGDPGVDALGLPTDSAVNAESKVANTPPPTATATEIPSDTPQVPSESELAKTDTGTPPPATDSLTPPVATTATELPPIEAAAVVPSTGRHAKVKAPHISARAKARNGVLLNRFYFVRKGDTPKAVSQLLYDSPKMSSKLLAWNGGKKSWRAGALIYYASPSDISDKKMMSYYQERNVAPEEYTVKQGDWLSRIASKKLGSVRSWKEIAVVNGIENPDSIEPGQKLAIFPVDLHGSPAAPVEVAPAKPVVAPPKPIAPVVEVPSNPPSTALADQPVPVPPPVNDAVPEVSKKKAPKGGLDFSRLVEQNLFMIVVGVGLAVLLIALLTVRGRRRAAEDGAADDGFASPRAKRR